MGIPEHLTCLLRNLYTGQEATVRTRHETTDWYQIWKGLHQGCILSPCLFNLYADYIICNAELDEAQAWVKIAGRNINNLRYADDTTLIVESEEELKSLLMKVKEESGKVGLKLNIQKTKIMASDPITSLQIDGETVETVRDFIFLSSKITADADCSHEMKRHLLLQRKVMTNLDSILKSMRHYFTNKNLSSQSYGLSSSHVQIWDLDYKENWELKNWCFWNVLEKALESPLDCKEVQPVHPKRKQFWLFIGRTDVEAETPILGHLMRRTDSLEKTLMPGKTECGRRRGDGGCDSWMASPTRWTWVWAGSRSWWWKGSLSCCSPWTRLRTELNRTDTLLNGCLLNGSYFAKHFIFTSSRLLFTAFLWGIGIRCLIAKSSQALCGL